MNKCCVVYTKYEEEMATLNDIDNNIEINKVFMNNNSMLYAQIFLKNELEFQCDRIIYPNGKIWQRADKEELEWVAKLKEDDKKLSAEVYCDNTLMYIMYITETEVL